MDQPPAVGQGQPVQELPGWVSTALDPSAGPEGAVEPVFLHEGSHHFPPSLRSHLCFKFLIVKPQVREVLFNLKGGHTRVCRPSDPVLKGQVSAGVVPVSWRWTVGMEGPSPAGARPAGVHSQLTPGS